MPADDYTSAVVGGGLKLKGSKPTGISKKKKKSKKEAPTSTIVSATEAANKDDGESSELQRALAAEDEALAAENKGSGEEEGGDGKTETERKYEEMRRKRLHERLKKEGGAKTHKQRVEELNRYLSNLSEHHDMPRIGPG